MEVHAILMALMFLLQMAIGALIFRLWKRVNARQDSTQEPGPILLEELQAYQRSISAKIDMFAERMTNKLDSIKDIIGVQNGFISSLLSARYEEKRSTGVKEDELAEEIDEGNHLWNQVKITPVVRSEGHERRLADLLSSSEFLENFWHSQMYKPADESRDQLIRFLVEKGQPEPEIEVYPPLQDENPNHWHFIIIQVRGHGGFSEKKRFVIPRHFDRFDPLWHSHLFDVRGRSTTPENFVTALHRCAMLNSSKDLTGYIDKTLVEKKGIISLEDKR